MSSETDTPPVKLVEVGGKDDRFLVPVLKDGEITVGNVAYPRVASNKLPEQVEAALLRYAPVPAMLPVWSETLALLDTPDEKDVENRTANRTVVLTGDPGLGKTTLAQVLQQATGGALHVVNCYDREISELVAETTVDGHHKFATMEKEVNARLRAGSMQATSMQLLKEVFAGQFVDDGEGKAHIDFNQETAGLVNASDRMDALRKVAEQEGIISGAGGHLIRKVPGPLFYALKAVKENKEPVVILLDEFARRRDAAGGDPRLWEILAGTRGEHEAVTIDGGNGEKFKLSNMDLKRNSTVVLLTSNYTTAYDPSVKPLPPALRSRLDSKGLVAADAADYAHRLQQHVLGAPISTLYEAQAPRWEGKGAYDGAPENFGQFVADLQVHGLTEEERQRVPAYQRSMAANWANVKDGTEQVAMFMADMQQMMNTRSSLYQRAELPDLIRDVQDEVQNLPSDHPSSQSSFNLRLAKKWVEEALTPARPVVKKGERPTRRPDNPVAPEEQLGTRLVEVIQENMDQIFPAANPNNERIRDYIAASMRRHGIFKPEALQTVDDSVQAMQQAQADAGGVDVQALTSVRSIVELLNTPREQGRDADIKAWQEILAAHIRAKYPEHFVEGAEVPVESVVSYQATKAAMDALTGGVRELAVEPTPGALTLTPVLQADPPPAGSNDGQFRLSIQPAAALTPTAPKAERVPDGAWNALVTAQAEGPYLDADQLLMTLAVPDAQQAVIPSLFHPTAGVSAAMKDVPSAVFSHAIANGESNPENNPYGLGLTTVSVVKGKTSEALHVMVQYTADADAQGNHPVEKTVIVGQSAISEPLKAKLAENRITYLSAEDTADRPRLDAEMQQMIHTGEARMKSLLRKQAEQTLSAAGQTGTPEDLEREVAKSFMPLDGKTQGQKPLKMAFQIHNLGNDALEAHLRQKAEERVQEGDEAAKEDISRKPALELPDITMSDFLTISSRDYQPPEKSHQTMLLHSKEALKNIPEEAGQGKWQQTLAEQEQQAAAAGRRV